MIVGRPVVYCGDGSVGTLNQLYSGTCAASPSPGCPVADITVATLGALYAVPQTNTSAGLANTGPLSGSYAWSGNW